jgi:hypothetical protein
MTLRSGLQGGVQCGDFGCHEGFEYMGVRWIGFEGCGFRLKRRYRVQPGFRV